MIKSIIDLLSSNDDDTIRLAFKRLNELEIPLSEKIEYLNASRFMMLIDPLCYYFDRPGNRLYLIDNLKGVLQHFNIGEEYYIPN